MLGIYRNISFFSKSIYIVKLSKFKMDSEDSYCLIDSLAISYMLYKKYKLHLLLISTNNLIIIIHTVVKKLS